MASPKETGGFGANTAPAVKPAPKQAKPKPKTNDSSGGGQSHGSPGGDLRRHANVFGMATFVVSYWLVTRQIMDVQPA